MKPSEPPTSRRSGDRVRLIDVARAAEVSHQTVSRVINQHPSVAPATRRRVLRIIEQLGYTPNSIARSLASKRSQMIGVISFGTTYYGPSQMLANIEQALRQRGYGLSFFTIGTPALDPLHAAVDQLLGQGVDGLVMITPIADIDMDALQRTCTKPFVMIDVALGSRVPSVTIDQHYGSHLAVQHLLQQGHVRIAEISGPPAWVDARLRHNGFHATLADHGLEPGPSATGDWTAAGGAEATRQLLAGGEPFTAILAGNDQMALGVLHVLRQAGKRVPHDVSVIGFDDIPEAPYFDPPLSTIRQDFEALGQQSVDYLLSLINAPDTPMQQRVLTPQLIVRASTAAPAGRAAARTTSPDR